MSGYDEWDRTYKDTPVPPRYRNTGDYGSDGRCVKCAASVAVSNMHTHSKWHTEIEKGIQVSAVAWCDPGDHAFKANEPGAISFTGQQTDEKGIPQTVQMDVCGKHSGRIFATPEQQEASRVREIESAYTQSTIDGNFTD